MASAGRLAAVIALILVVIGVGFVIGTEVSCSAFPFCSVSPTGYWGAFAFFGLALVSGTVRALGREGHPTERPPTD
jgi:hypothetical protein